MKRVTAMSIFFLVLAGSLLQAGEWNDGFSNPYVNLNSLLNPANMRMRHTMSFMTSVSSQGDGYYQSVYTNHLFYSFHPKLDLNVDLNFVNYGTVDWDNSFSISSNNDNTSRVVPEFSLNYRPTDNTSIRIEFRSMGLHQQRYDHWRW